MTQPAIGDVWPNVYGYNTGNLRKALYGSFLVRDGDGVNTSLAFTSVNGIWQSGFTPFSADKQFRTDLMDHNQINPELGGEPALMRLHAALREAGLGLILDIVPNHMGVGGSDNAWWMDVLEWGRQSTYATFFDLGAGTSEGPEFATKIETKKDHIWQSRQTVRTDVTSEEGTVKFGLAEYSTRADELEADLPLGSLAPQGTPNYAYKRPNEFEGRTRQILAFGVDKGQNYFVDVFPAVSVEDLMCSWPD